MARHDDDIDFFDGPDIPDPPAEPKEPKKPEPSPESPDYWEEESEWEHLRPLRRRRTKVYALLGVVGLCLLVWLWMWLFTPYVTDATQFGYVEGIEHRGTILKSYEGELIPYRELNDTTRVYDRNFEFTAADAKVAARLKRFQFSGLPVRVTYKRYHTRMFWRGETKTVVTAADSVDPRTILPPEFAPAQPYEYTPRTPLGRDTTGSSR